MGKKNNPFKEVLCNVTREDIKNAMRQVLTVTNELRLKENGKTLKKSKEKIISFAAQLAKTDRITCMEDDELETIVALRLLAQLIEDTTVL